MCGGGDKVDDVEGDEKKKYGSAKQHDPKFKGPIKNRSCTDIICCIIFLICIAGMAACSIVGYARGDPVRLVYPTDSYGNMCGTGNYKDRPFLFFFDMLECARMGAAVVSMGCPTPQVCVSSCPVDNWVFLQTIAAESITSPVNSTERKKMICRYTYNDAQYALPVLKLVEDKTCAAYYVKSVSVVNRCIPAIFGEITDLASALSYKYNNQSYNISSSSNKTVTGNDLTDASFYMSKFYAAKEFVELIYKDIIASWWMILVGFGIALFLSMLWIVLMRWIVGIMVWITIAGVFGIVGFGTYYCYNQYYSLKSMNATSNIGVSQAFALNFSYYLSLKETWLAFGCTLATVLVILLLLFIFLVHRICIAIQIIKESSRAVGSMFSTLLWPVFPFFFEVAIFIYWVVSVVYIASMGNSEYYSNSTTNTSTDGVNYLLSRIPCDKSASTAGSVCEFVKYGGDKYIIPMQVFMLFMLLWVLNFIVALGQMTLAGAFASYYWAFKKPDDVPAFPLTASLLRSLRYHLGSLAFGSFIIAVVQLIRIFLEYLDYKLKGSENPVAKFILKCLKCCFWCLEKFLKFLNKNAYIMIAMRGRNFCFSAKDAFMLIMRNIVRVVVLDKVTDFVFFLSKLIITAAICLGSFYWFNGKIDFLSNYVQVPNLNYYLTPVIILTLGTYLMTCLFFNVYSMAVDTLFLCFLEDLEMNDGSPEKPYYMSKGLMKILNKKNKKAKATKSD